jgi:hypothetical protein
MSFNSGGEKEVLSLSAVWLCGDNPRRRAQNVGGDSLAQHLPRAMVADRLRLSNVGSNDGEW